MSTSARMGNTVSTLSFRTDMKAEPEIVPMFVSTDAPSPSRVSSISSPDMLVDPPVRMTAPAMPARPILSAGSLTSPTPMRALRLIIGSLWSSTRYRMIPLSRTTRVGVGVSISLSGGNSSSR